MPRLIDVDALNEFLKGSFQTENIRSGDNDGYFFQKGWNDAIKFILTSVEKKLTIEDFEPVRHGEWDSKYDEHDGFYHHFCTECKNLAIFTYDEQDDYDEGMDGEWYLLGKNIVGIKENLTDYCPNCGSKMYKEE